MEKDEKMDNEATAGAFTVPETGQTNDLHRNLKSRHMQMIAMYVFRPRGVHSVSHSMLTAI